MNAQEKLLCEKYHANNAPYGILTFACGAHLKPCVLGDMEALPTIYKVADAVGDYYFALQRAPTEGQY